MESQTLLLGGLGNYTARRIPYKINKIFHTVISLWNFLVLIIIFRTKWGLQSPSNVKFHTPNYFYLIFPTLCHGRTFIILKVIFWMVPDSRISKFVIGFQKKKKVKIFCKVQHYQFSLSPSLCLPNICNVFVRVNRWGLVPEWCACWRKKKEIQRNCIEKG